MLADAPGLIGGGYQSDPASVWVLFGIDVPQPENYRPRRVGGCSSAWLEPQIVDLVVAGSNPVSHPILRPHGLRMASPKKSQLEGEGCPPKL